MADNDSRDGTPRGLAKSEQISEKNYPLGDCDASTPHDGIFWRYTP